MSKVTVRATVIPEHLVSWVEAASTRPLGSGISSAASADEILCAARIESGAPLGSWVELDAQGAPLAFMWFDG